MKENAIIDPETMEPQIEPTQQDAETAEQSPLEKKAAAILRARLPHLVGNGLNFEKRTGAFFKATIETVKDADGNVKYDEKGVAIEKMRRTVVEEDAIPAEAAEEVAVKRAAALIAGAEAKREAATKAVEEAKNALAEATQKAAALESEIEDAAAAVEAYNLPEKPARQTVTTAALKEKAEKAISEAERLRNLLISLGVDPDKADE